jgi:DMSO/TMAO reductase YedYZ molybdopterin-dependent catalytic subunit
MKRSVYLLGMLYGLCTSFIVMAFAYLGFAIFALPFFPFNLFDWLARHLPGAVIHSFIQLMVSLITALGLGPIDVVAKLGEQIQALLLISIVGIGFGLALAVIRQWRREWLIWAGLLLGFILWLGLVIVELSLSVPSSGLLPGLVWLLGLMVGWGWVLSRLSAAVVYEVISPGSPEVPLESNRGRTIDRRQFFALAGSGLASLVVLALGLRNFHNQAQGISAPGAGSQPKLPGDTPLTPPVFGPEYTSGPAASPAPGILAKRIEPAPGTRPEITPVDNFYRIDINALPSDIHPQSWKLELKGLVQKPLTFTLDELRNRPSITQAVTMSCVSNPLGGDLIGTNFWTGVPFKDVLLQAGVLPEAKGVKITAADTFYEYVPLTEAMDDRTLLVYAMNGEPLTTEHGFPLRIYIPNHYGMKQPKWIIGMEVTDTPNRGFWGDRGWEPHAVPKTTSVIDTYEVDRNLLEATGTVPVGGIAWAGARGIKKVEVQVDTTPWVEAVLRRPTISPLTWVQWRYDWKPASKGVHTIRVRAMDGNGDLQDPNPTTPGPEAATGIYSVVVFI